MTTRQDIYNRIRSASKDEVILEEMIRLGFWPRGGTLPEDPADEIRELGELQRQLSALTTENTRLHNAAALKKALRKKRLEESKRKRQENKERRLRERAERAAAWKERQRTEINFLGPKVSLGLGNVDTDEQKLKTLGLPVLRSAVQLAEAMEISIGHLRFLAFDRRTSTISHYRRFAIKKKTGGQRKISAPMPRLKRAQYWILQNILSRVELHPNAHGFRPGRSIVTNAAPHVGRQVVINVDLKDFFPSISYRRVKGVFRSLGYSEAVATILGLICTERDAREVRIDGRTYFVGRGDRVLPQGAPTSPTLTNIICRGMDARLTRLAQQLDGSYTRYADDMTLSFKDRTVNVGIVLRRIHHVVQDEDLTVHPDKTRVQRAGSRQEVTGLTVNQRVSVPRHLLRRFRATLFQIEKDGPGGKQWGRSNDVIAAIEGFANFVKMVEPEKGTDLFARVQSIIEKHGRGLRQYPKRRRWKPPTPAREATRPGTADVANSDERSASGSQPNVVGNATPGDARDGLLRPFTPSSDPAEQGKKSPWWKFW